VSTEDNKALVRRYYEEILTRRDPQLVDELFSPDYVYHYADTPPGLSNDREGFKQFVTHFLSGYPQMQFHVDDQTIEGDKVISHITAQSGIPVGPMRSIPADPQEIAKSDTAKGTSTDRIANGKIAESWLDFDIPNPLPQEEELPPKNEHRQ
jgi:predicted SnoaL-like aldol condensation-catalyzing enzyme